MGLQAELQQLANVGVSGANSRGAANSTTAALSPLGAGPYNPATTPRRASSCTSQVGSWIASRLATSRKLPTPSRGTSSCWARVRASTTVSLVLVNPPGPIATARRSSWGH